MVVVVVSCDGGWLGVQLVAPVESLARKLAEAFVASGALTAQPFDTVRSLRTRPAHTPCAHALRTRPAHTPCALCWRPMPFRAPLRVSLNARMGARSSRVVRHLVPRYR
jgi:hypothetical protein